MNRTCNDCVNLKRLDMATRAEISKTKLRQVLLVKGTPFISGSRKEVSCKSCLKEASARMQL